jgi:hypothetical protein
VCLSHFCALLMTALLLPLLPLALLWWWVGHRQSATSLTHSESHTHLPPRRRRRRRHACTVACAPLPPLLYSSFESPL